MWETRDAGCKGLCCDLADGEWCGCSEVRLERCSSDERRGRKGGERKEQKQQRKATAGLTVVVEGAVVPAEPGCCNESSLTSASHSPVRLFTRKQQKQRRQRRTKERASMAQKEVGGPSAFGVV